MRHCRTDPYYDGRARGDFTWHCERGRVKEQMLRKT